MAAGVVVVRELWVVLMVAEPVESVVPVMMSLLPLTVAWSPAAEKPLSALSAAAAAVRESGVEPRLTVAGLADPTA